MSRLISEISQTFLSSSTDVEPTNLSGLALFAQRVLSAENSLLGFLPESARIYALPVMVCLGLRGFNYAMQYAALLTCAQRGLQVENTPAVIYLLRIYQFLDTAATYFFYFSLWAKLFGAC